MEEKDYKEQWPHEILERINRKENLILIDVREQDEWDAGHIPGAKHIPLGTIPESLEQFDSTKETIIICRSGGRSGRACEYLTALGYNVVNMQGGMLQWTGEVEY